VKTRLSRREFIKVSVQGAAIAGFTGLTGYGYRSLAMAADISQAGNPALRVTSLIENFTLTSSLNTLNMQPEEKAFDKPIVGFASGADPIFQQYKKIIGPYHWTPLEIFKLTFPEVKARDEDLTVISWVHPITKSIKTDLRKKKDIPSEKWVRNRLYGEALNNAQRKYISEVLTKAGHHAIAPTQSPSYIATFWAPWSERHSAYVCGLGTFGLCEGLITPKGKAIRLGSVVAKIQIDPTPRPYDNHHAYCLFYAKGTCGMCIKRCPAGAITKEGHDKMKCYMQKTSTQEYAKNKYHLTRDDAYGCGFCQTGVPCESKIPV
jgi:ferredoxin